MALSQEDNDQAPISCERSEQSPLPDEGSDRDMPNGSWFRTDITAGSLITLAGSLVAVGIAYRSITAQQDAADKAFEAFKVQHHEALATVSRRISANSGADTRRKNELSTRIRAVETALTELTATLKEREQHQMTQAEFRELRATLRFLQLQLRARRPNGSTNSMP